MNGDEDGLADGFVMPDMVIVNVVGVDEVLADSHDDILTMFPYPNAHVAVPVVAAVAEVTVHGLLPVPRLYCLGK